MGHLPYFIEILVILKIALSLGLTCVLRHNSRVYLGSRDAREQAAQSDLEKKPTTKQRTCYKLLNKLSLDVIHIFRLSDAINCYDSYIIL